MTGDRGRPAARQLHPGEIVSKSGIYRLAHHPQHADMPSEVMLIKGRRFPACQPCKGISFELFYAAKYVEEVEHLQEEEFIPAGLQGLSSET
jgi:hypothetical protein